MLNYTIIIYIKYIWTSYHDLQNILSSVNITDRMVNNSVDPDPVGAV